jgi:hypothetical protein
MHGKEAANSISRGDVSPINRGNYRKDLFESVGSAEAFLKVLGQGTPRFGWKLHA